MKDVLNRTSGVKATLFTLLLIFTSIQWCVGQMPPPGYERAKKIEAERMAMLSIDRDSIIMIDTVMLFDPVTYESETRIIEHRISVRDYCLTMLGIAKPEILLDGKPHTIIDPRTYEEITIQMNSRGLLDTIPKR